MPRDPGIEDLAQTTIRRGREHGVPGYIYFVEYCSGVQLKNWEDFIKFIPKDYVLKLAAVYKYHDRFYQFAS